MILLTGASGFLGKNVLKNLKNENLEVLPTYFKNEIEGGVKLDVSDINQVESLCKNNKFKIVIHCASEPSSKVDKDKVKTVLNSNLLSIYNLCENLNTCYFINISSILASNPENDFSEDSYQSNGFYGFTKASSELLLNQYADKVRAINLRPCAIVGKNTTHGFIHDLKRKLFLDSETLELFGDEPGSIRPFVHIDDVTSFIVNIVKDIFGKREHIDFRTINVCPSDNISVKEIAEAAMKNFDIKKKIIWTGSNTWRGDLSSIKAKNSLLVKNKLWNPVYKTSKEAVLEVLK